MSAVLRLDGQVVLVTGAGGGLGRAYAQELARRGAHLVVNDIKAEAASEVVDEIRAGGGSALVNTDSVADPDGCAAMVAATLAQFGRIDGLVCNAGTISIAPFQETRQETLSALLNVHLGGAFHLAQAVWAPMSAQGGGHIVFTTSSAGMFGMPQLSAYGAAKGAVAGLMGVLAEEGRSLGIRCNAVMPNAASGMTAEIGRSARGEGGLGPNPWVADALATFDPRFTAALVAWLLHPDCPSTHGIYSVAAGRMARVCTAPVPGWHGPLDRPPTLEEIAAHWAEICDPGGGVEVPANAYDEFRIVAESRLR
ncbi:SDR family NAD(P)-dependent oxidoreductase [Sphingomonas sp. 35-24ZXX]|uniref:SDR family NAD(P)-dependent oxidoreductase n=1 Tax=Sphingomonas sp. 35-24ZXX TaxID=1545915 RepID=UPI001E61BF06|nr:SDR family NAD(P)-dependent oxidoreductase [Sphingomonas sp. 35-24ZXX]